MRTFVACLLAALLAAPHAAPAAGNDLSVKGVRYFSYPTFTRVVFEIEAAAPYVLNRTDDGRGIVFTAYDGRFAVAASLPAINDGVVRSLEVKRDAARPYVFVHLDTAAGEVKDFVLRGPDRIVLDISRKAAAPVPPVPSPPASAPAAVPPSPAAAVPPQPPAPPAQSKMVVVLDPGHGGREAGIVTAHGYEKAKSLELALAIKKELKKLLPDAAVVLTRDRDVAVSLAGRAAASNAAGAALFISLHFSTGKDAQVYILGVSEGGGSRPRSAPRDFLGLEAETGKRETLWGSQQQAHAAESSSLGRAVSLAGRAAASNAAGAALFISLHFSTGKDAQVYILGVTEGGGSRPRSAPRDFLGLEAETGKRETLWGSQQQAHAAESSSLGRAVSQQLTGRSDRGPAQAPLALLSAVDAPAVLVEVGFEQNRARAAEAIARGVEAYAGKRR